MKEGDVCTIEGGSAAEPLLQAVYEEVLTAGGNPIVQMALEEQAPAFFEHASDEQLEWVSPTSEWIVENADVRIAVMALREHPRALAGPARAPDEDAGRAPAPDEADDGAQRRGRLPLGADPVPDPRLRVRGRDEPRRDYEDFYYGACLATEDDPVGAWKRQSEETERLKEWIEGRSEVHVTGEGTDLRLGIEGRKFIAAGGRHNMPDGEFFTGPVEDSAEGEVSFHLPATYAGREVAGVRFRFEGGKVVDATAEKGEEFLIEMLDTDEGARRLGELGIGTNYGITDGTGEILLDEKIGGTVHLAVGRSYPETGGVNESAIHWDMICDLRRGGRIEVDGELLQQDGRFVGLSDRNPRPRARVLLTDNQVGLVRGEKRTCRSQGGTMNAGKLGRIGAQRSPSPSWAAWPLGRRPRRASGQEVKNVTKTYTKGVGGSLGGVPITIPDGGGDSDPGRALGDPGQGAEPARQDRRRQRRRPRDAPAGDRPRVLSRHPARRDQPQLRQRRGRQQLRRRARELRRPVHPVRQRQPDADQHPGAERPVRRHASRPRRAWTS